MSGELSVRVNVMRLYNGRRSFYLAITIGRRRYWVSRWDTDRVRPTDGAWQRRGEVMTWYGGRS
jgi:hypothetical protein